MLLYCVLLVATGVAVGRRVRTSGEFFVAGRALPAGLVFVTLLAANIGAGSTVGASGLGYRHGLSAWWWSGSAAIGCLILGLWVAPRLWEQAAHSGFFTVGDFLEARYGRPVRGLIAGILWLGTLSILAGQLLAMAWALQVVLGLPRPAGCLLSGLVLAAYYTGGGLLASVWVNLVELVVLIGGFALALPFAWHAAGGWPALRAAGESAAYGSFMGMGGAAVAGLLVTFVPSFIVSPGLIQKAFGARSARAAGLACLGNAVALGAFAFVPALLGMAARVLRPHLPNAELALPVLMVDVLPSWLGALALAALFAAEISTADAVLFMLSTSLSKDLYQAFLRPQATPVELLRVGRLASVTGAALGVALALLLPTVADALKIFYAVMTISLFAPVMVGLWPERRVPTAPAVAAVVLAMVAGGGGFLLLRGSPSAAWLPYVAGVALSLLVLISSARRS